MAKYRFRYHLLRTWASFNVTITAVAFAPGTPRASSAIGAHVGYASTTTSGGALTNPGYTLTDTAGGKFRMVGAEVQFAAGTVALGTYSITIQATADNAPSVSSTVSVSVIAQWPAVAVSTAGTVAAGNVTLRVKAIEAVAAGSPMTCVQPFAPGDLPAGNRVTLKLAGVAVPVQQDQEVTWTAPAGDAGSLRIAALSWRMPNAVAAGTEVVFTLGREAIVPDRTPHKTLASTRATSDIQLRMTGLDCGASTWVAGLNEITTTFAELSPTTGYGVNPAGGWKTVRSGPIVTEYEAWRYVKDSASAAYHKWAVARVHVREWVSGDRESWFHVLQPNAHDALVGGTLGPAVQEAFRCFAEAFDGATRLYAFSGTNSSRVATVPVANVNGTTNQITLGAPAFNYWANGSAVAFSGAMPSGITAATVAYPKGVDAATTSDFKVGRHDDSAQLALGTVPGSGTLSILPVTNTYAGTGHLLMTTEAWPVWQGAAPRPNLLVGHDEAYLFQRTRAVPPYRIPAARPAPATAPGGPTYHSGSMDYWWRGIDAPGDGELDPRIGWFIPTGGASLIVALDPERDQRNRVYAGQWSTFMIEATDERSGFPPVGNRGPAENDVTYPGLGPVNKDFRLHPFSSEFTGTPGWGYGPKWYRQFTDPSHSGYFSAYTIFLDGSHCPDTCTVPYLKTGNISYVNIQLSTTLAVFFGQFNRNRTIGSRTYYGGAWYDTRIGAWDIRNFFNCELILPDAHLYRRVIYDYNTGKFDFFRDIIPNRNSETGWIGENNGAPLSASFPYPRAKVWMNSMFVMACGMTAWPAQHPSARPVFEYVMKFNAQFLDDERPGAVGGGYRASDDTTSVGPQYSVFRTMREVDAIDTAFPLPMTDFRASDPGLKAIRNSYSRMAASSLMIAATNIAHGTAADVNGRDHKRMAEQIINRAMSPPVNGLNPVDANNCVPTFDWLAVAP